MSYENWKNKTQGFQTMDVRHIQGSFFEGLKKRAEALEVGEGQTENGVCSDSHSVFFS